MLSIQYSGSQDGFEQRAASIHLLVHLYHEDKNSQSCKFTFVNSDDFAI